MILVPTVGALCVGNGYDARWTFEAVIATAASMQVGYIIGLLLKSALTHEKLIVAKIPRTYR